MICPWVDNPEAAATAAVELLPPEADMVSPCGSWTGDGDESGDEVMEVTCGIWISCLMCSGEVYMDWLLPPLRLLLPPLPPELLLAGVGVLPV